MNTLFVVEFRQACQQKGCPFCTLAQQHTRRYLSRLLYEYTLAPDIHQRLAQARGLCNPHAWLLQYIAHAEQPDGVGVALFYGSVAERLHSDLQACLSSARSSHARRAGGSSLASRLWNCLQTEETCLACERQAESERYALTQFLQDLHDSGEEEGLARLYRDSAGACLPHFLALLHESPSEQAVLWLAQTQIDKTARLAAQLQEFVRKRSLPFQNDPMGEERDSWVRVIEQMIGKRAVPLRRSDHRSL
jgi:hypothetical protein